MGSKKEFRKSGGTERGRGGRGRGASGSRPERGRQDRRAEERQPARGGTVVRLQPGRDFSVRRGHPWIFSGAIARLPQDLKDGDVVDVESDEGEVLGTGHYAEGGSIAVKMLSRSRVAIDEAFFLERIGNAKRYRESLGIPKAGITTGFRLVHGEGDRLPGLILDVYDDVFVIQAQSPGMFRARELIAGALENLFPTGLRSVVDRSLASRREENEESSGASELLRGESARPLIRENGLLFRVDCLTGQKTGFFLDQRDNRHFLRGIAEGRNVLNAFCYSGGFSMAALAGGAKSVVSLDSSEKALAILEENLLENRQAGIVPEAASHTTVCEDFLHYMQGLGEDFDLIVLDPPAFAKHRRALDAGLRGYRSINTAALTGVRPGGFLLSFSCSQLVTRDDFREVLLESAAKAARPVRIVKELHQAPCHPVSLSHPEGEYLKGFVLEVGER